MDQKIILAVLCIIALARATKSAESTAPSEVNRLNASDTRQWRILKITTPIRPRTSTRKGSPSKTFTTVKRNDKILMINNGQGTRTMTTVKGGSQGTRTMTTISKGLQGTRTMTTIRKGLQSTRIPMNVIPEKLKNAPTKRPTSRSTTTARRTTLARAITPQVVPYSFFGVVLNSLPLGNNLNEPSETSTTEAPIDLFYDVEGSSNSTSLEDAVDEETDLITSDYDYGSFPENTTVTDAPTETVTNSSTASSNITTTLNPNLVRKRRKKTTTATSTVSTPRSGVAMIRVKRKRTTLAPVAEQ